MGARPPVWYVNELVAPKVTVPPQANSKKRHSSRETSLLSPELRGLVNVITVTPSDNIATALDITWLASSGGGASVSANLCEIAHYIKTHSIIPSKMEH